MQKDIRSLVGDPDSSLISNFISTTLIEPLEDLFSRPSKKFRSDLVELCFRLAAPDLPEDRIDSSVKELSFVLECIHAGSLIIDDIQDQSHFRRGAPSIHSVYGVATALNAGNWLYFWPFEKVRGMGLKPELELAIYQLCHEAMSRAHIGQALDVGVDIRKIPQQQISEVCKASLELKSGALMSLAASLGSTLACASPARHQSLQRFGHDLGLGLQMFDDLGNLTPQEHPTTDPKKYEDLRLGRPSWFWLICATHCSEDDFADLKDKVESLPDPKPIDQWLRDHDLLKVGREEALRHINSAIQTLADALEPELSQSRHYQNALSDLRGLVNKVVEGYGKK